MLFNSVVFMVFAVVFFSLWAVLKRSRNGGWAFLIAASFLFYGWWDWRFLFLIVFSGMIDYVAALAMQSSPQKKKLWLGLSLFANLGSLGVFKYSGFVLENLRAIGLPLADPDFSIVLPVGISFYTFQSMSYTIDVYKGQLKPTKNILKFFAYLSLFPQLVAGPIVRASEFLDQLDELKTVTPTIRWEGLRLITHGFFKKVVIADNLAVTVDACFKHPDFADAGALWWIVVTMFAFQIYCDFSGYTDIARGLAKWMGYEFPENFNHPYTSTSLREFWTRWHISLSSWFRDYVYIPLGGSRKGNVRAHINMWITMVVSGLWHGAAWTYVIWGAIHAFCLSVERETKWPKRLGQSQLGSLVALLIVTFQVYVAWIFFRAVDLEQGIRITQELYQMPSEAAAQVLRMAKPERALLVLAVAILREAYIYTTRKVNWEMPLPAPLQVAAIAALIALSFLFRGPGAAFVYFQF